MNVRPFQAGDEQALTGLIADFRVSLGELQGNSRPPDLPAAGEELAEYFRKAYPIYVAEVGPGMLAGYLVCRVDGDTVWAESLYTAPQYRRQGVGATLYAQAEHLAGERGGGSPFNWVDPENEVAIRFLQTRGYNVLNLIELRRPYPGEAAARTIQVGPHGFQR